MSDIPSIYPGPPVDGQRTWFCQGRDIPKGWERQQVNLTTDGGKRWFRASANGGPIGYSWYLVRPVKDIIVTRGDWSKTLTWRDIRQAIGFGGRTTGVIDGDEIVNRVWDLLTEGASS